MNKETGSQFLKEKYGLHKAEEVEKAKQRTEKRTVEKVPQTPEARIQNYLDRFSEILERKDPVKKERGLNTLKQILYRDNVIKPAEIPEGYFENQRRIARELGHGDIEITPQMRRELTEVIINDQKTSLDNWIDYLSSPDAVYPMWLKYYALRNVLIIGDYDKEKKQFTKRSKTTTKPFPDLNREALAYVLNAINKKAQKENISTDNLNPQEQEQFDKLLASANFAKLYAWAIEKVTPEEGEALKNTKGEWIKYNQGDYDYNNQQSDLRKLVDSLQGHGTGWCTAGESTAKTQLAGGDFYVYYSLDQKGNPTIPRAAIRMNGKTQIAEVRGIAPEQNLDPYIAPVLDKKLESFGSEGEKYKKRSADMKKLTEIYNKFDKNENLTKEDLKFLYEIDDNIEGFGYKKDPRIAEIRKTRNLQEDASIIFDCAKEQIATNPVELDQNSKAFIGPLFPGIFDKIKKYNIEHIYTSFPERKISRLETIIGGKNKEELLKELKEKFQVSYCAEGMIESSDFKTLEKFEKLNLVKLRVDALGIPGVATVKEIYDKAKELGLELCPAETGPHLRLEDIKQFLGDFYLIAMTPISDRYGSPYVFDVGRRGSVLWLDDAWAGPDCRWLADRRVVFSLRKLEA